MIIVEIGRGLGNSLYVYAAGKALAKHYNTELKLDTSYLKSWPKFEKFGGEWEPELKRLNITSKEASNKEIRKFVLKTGFRPFDKIIKKYKLFESNVYRFGTFDAIENFWKLPDNIYLWGYFGDEKFFRGIKEEIKKEFTLKEEEKAKINPLLKKISKENSVSIHVRRGDLLTLNMLVLDVDYYKKAVEMIKKKIKNPIFYVFSDDIKWCKENFKNFGKNFIFIEGNKGWEDFELMRVCKHNVLANSALSWWAGYLNPNKKKIVICPSPFTHFVDSSKKNPDTTLREWKKIDVLKKY